MLGSGAWQKTTTALRGVRVLVAVTLVLVLARTAWAEPSAGDKAAAEALFNHGRELVDAGQFAEACPKFEASLKLDEALGTQLHLADCYERSGKLASAWALFKAVQSKAGVRKDPDRGQIAQVRAEALEPHLVRLVIEVPTELPEGFEVTRNGKPILPALYRVATPTDEGTWTIRATAPGHEPFETSVDLTQAGVNPFTVQIPALTPTAGVDTTPAPKPAAIAPVDAIDPPSGRTQRTVGLLVAGVGIAAGIVSVIFTVRAAQKNDDSKAHCTGNDCREAGFAARNDAFDLAAVATGAGILGVIGVGAGTALYLTAPSPTEPSGSGDSGELRQAQTLGLFLEGSW